MLNKIRRLTNLTLLEQILFFQLTVFSFGIKVALTIMPLPRLADLLSRHSSSARISRIPFPHARCSRDQVVKIIDLATTVSHRERRCLPRALLLFWILRAQQKSADLCLGVHTALATLYAHAWVELEGVAVGDPHTFINRYTPILRFPA